MKNRTGTSVCHANFLKKGQADLAARPRRSASRVGVRRSTIALLGQLPFRRRMLAGSVRSVDSSILIGFTSVEGVGRHDLLLLRSRQHCKPLGTPEGEPEGDGEEILTQRGRFSRG